MQLLSNLSLRDWLELVAVIVIAFSSVMRWVHTRETTDSNLEGRVRALETVDAVCVDDFKTVQRDIAEVRKRLEADHAAQKHDREHFNELVGTVSNEIARHDERLKSLFARLGTVERRLDQQGKA